VGGTGAFVKTYLAWLRMVRGQADDARALGSEIVAIGQEHGYAYWMLLGSAYAAGAGTDRADLDGLEQTIAMLQALGQQVFAASHLHALSQLYADRGDIEKAMDLVEQALALVVKTGEELHRPELLRWRAALALERGEPAQRAAQDLREAVALAAEQGAHLQRLRAATALAGLPPQIRPPEWRTLLADARADVSSDLSHADAAAADRLLW
jgi:tetratricopeptide (TPR) repeat protein